MGARWWEGRRQASAGQRRRRPGQGGLWAEPGWLGPELRAGVGGSAGQDDSSLWPCASRPLNTLAHHSLYGPPVLRRSGLLGRK